MGNAGPHQAHSRGAGPDKKRRSAWQRVLAAQESGLLLVIALAVLTLTLVAGEKDKPWRIDVPAGATVSRVADYFIVKEGTSERRYGRDSGWRIDSSSGTARVVKDDTQTREDDSRDIPDEATVEDGPEVIKVRVGAGADEYLVKDGWRVDDKGDGARRLVKESKSSILVSPPGLPKDGVTTKERGQIVVKGAGVEFWLPERTAWRYIEESEQNRYLIGSVVANKFFEKENLVLLTTKASYFAVIAVGMTAIIVLAGIDLSVGSIYAVAAIVGAMALQQLSPEAGAWVSVPVGMAVCCAVGALLGMANGAMIVGLRLHPFIITLGTMAIYRGVVLLLTGGQTVSDLPESIQKGFFKAEYAGVYPTLTIIMVIVAVIGTFVLQKTVLGRRIYAIGGNETAAYYAGIPVGRVKLIVYTLGGLLAGLSACMEVGYNATASVGAGQGYELNVIAAAVIGGASLSGGRGSALGAVLGAILVSLIDNAMVILDISQNYNQIVMGGAIVLAVAVDQLKRKYLKD